MGYDPFSPIASAQINILCVPAGKITAHKFEEYLRAFRAFSIISVNNVTSTSSFSSSGDGQILLNIGKHVSDDGVVKHGHLNLNAKPQLVLTLVDGEAIATTSEQHGQEWLESVLSTAQRHTAALNDLAHCAVIVLGGNQISTFDGLYFVDLDGDGPSLFDALSDTVRKLLIRFDRFATDIQGPNPEPLRTEGGDQTSSAPSEAVRNLPNRVNGSSAVSTATSLSNNEHGEATIRSFALIGQLNLQAGCWSEAIRSYSKAAAIAQTSTYHLWHAKSLEGLIVCMLLSAWIRIEFEVPQICYPASDKKGSMFSSQSMNAVCAANRSISESTLSGKSTTPVDTLTMSIPNLVSTIINLYERAAGIFQDGASFKLLCETQIRWGNLLLAMKGHGGTLNDAVLQSVVEGIKADPVPRSKNSTSALTLHGKALAKLFVDAVLEVQPRLSIQEAAPLHVAAASSLSELGVERKQAFYLRQFLQSLGPALIEARRVGAAEAGIHPSATMPQLDIAGDNLNGSNRSGIQALLNSVCESYGLRSQGSSSSASSQASKDRLRDALFCWTDAHRAGDIMMKIDVLNLCIEVSEAIPDLRCSLDYMSRLLQLSVGSMTLNINLHNPAPLILINEQSRLLSNIGKVVSAAARYDFSDVRAEFWDKCLVRLIEVGEEPLSNRLMHRTAQDLSLASHPKNDMGKDPFIFNPFAKTKGRVGQSVIVVGEQARFNVMLQNPLQVDVEIEDIALIVEGCDFEPDHHSIVLGPLCSQVFTLTGKARQQGDLSVSGCRATISGCHTEDFLIVEGHWKPSRLLKHTSGPTTSHTSQEIVLPEIKKLELKATAPLPRLRLDSTSLLQESLMLLEGEKTVLTLTLRNDSDLEVDFVLFSFDDSVTRRLEEALTNKDLVPADMYEIQNQIATRPVIRMVESDDAQENIRIPAFGMVDFSLELFGRPGLTDISVMVDYAFLGKPRDHVHEPFYTRQLRHTITTTINGSIDIPRCSVLPVENDLIAFYDKSATTKQEGALFPEWGKRHDKCSQCMLLLDIRNIWPAPLEVRIKASHDPTGIYERFSEEIDVFVVSETLQPGQMTRLLVLAPRILVTNPYMPIPSLDTKRQFVVSASKMTIEAEAASRESFWYRERLLKCLQASWSEQTGHRTGQIDLRKGIRLSSRMIDALRIDLVEISFLLKAKTSAIDDSSTDSKSIAETGDSHYALARNSFASLIIRVHNHSTNPLRLLLRLQPSLRHQPHNIALDLSKRLAWTGVLQRALHPPLEQDETREVELGIIALAEGQYEINATAEEIRSRSSRSESITFGPGNGAERRIWHARKPCSIDTSGD